MGKKLYVGNLPYTTTVEDLRSLFADAGEIVSVTVITDRETGRSKGFGFVEMASDAEADEAIRRFNGSSIDKRVLTVNEARPREERPRYGDSGGRERGGYSGGGERGGYSGGGERGGYSGGKSDRGDRGDRGGGYRNNRNDDY